MKSTYLFIVLLMLVFNYSNAQNGSGSNTQVTLKKGEKKVINDFLANLRATNINKMQSMVVYPLKRQYPLPSVKNVKDFQREFNNLFDKNFKRALISSSSNLDQDWKSVGYKGLMFKNGELWLDSNGKITSISYQSSAEKSKRLRIIALDKKTIHPTLRNFDEPILVMKTAQQQIRIDQLADGKYRYAAWPITAKFTGKPTLVINGGTYHPEGSGGNHKYKFEDKGSQHECFINVIGTSQTPEAELVISKNGTVQSTFPAQLVKP
ncbi:MAG: hypothetical protein MK212_10390 [Saprospiraceae bacterium]|nr:hypothetical protein [Saprospiraceae bacterium]